MSVTRSSFLNEKGFAALLACAALFGLSVQPGGAQISAPRIGVVRYSGGDLHPVFGLAGNYVIGKRFLDHADAVSFSSAGGMVFRDGMVLLLNSDLASIASFQTSSPQAITGIGETLQSAVAFLPAQQALVHWDGQSMVSVPVGEEAFGSSCFGFGTVTPESVTLLCQSGAGTAATGTIDEYAIAPGTGALLTKTTLPLKANNAYRQGNWLIFIAEKYLIALQADSGLRKTIPIAASQVTFEQVSETCVHMRAADSGRDWLLHFGADQPSLQEMPGAPVESAQTGAAQ